MILELLQMMYVAVVMYRARKRKMQPYDFEKLVEELRVKGELQNKKAQGNGNIKAYRQMN